jgi:ABC-type bacteriocin/lantibiotic exporter with double-glycine peptidase domain
MLIVGSILLVNQQLNIGQFIAAEIVILLIIGSVEKLMVNLDTVYDVLTSVEKLGKLTDKQLEEDGNIQLVDENNGLAVEMNNVSFSYEEDNTSPILSHINLSIKSNEKICIMGATGSGKSTLLRLSSGVYNYFSGNIFINNIPVSNYKLESLRSQTGISLHNLDIFQGSLMENITMGSNEISAQEILKLAEKIGLKAFMSDLNDGLNTKIDPIGKKLSRNIIQKILLLRALVNSPRLVLMEEPFEGLSDIVSQSIKEYLLNHTPHQTILISCNDESFAASCDKVIYLEKGKVKAFGNWNDIKSSIKN